jgi:hypothetical protein
MISSVIPAVAMDIVVANGFEQILGKESQNINGSFVAYKQNSILSGDK